MAEAEYWRFTVARDCQKKNTSENHSEYRLGAARVLPSAIGRLSSCEKGVLAPLSIIGCVTYAPLSGVYECPLCSHGPRGPVGV